MLHPLAFILGTLGPAVVLTRPAALLLWLLGIPLYCGGTVGFVTRLPGGFSTAPALFLGVLASVTLGASLSRRR